MGGGEGIGGSEGIVTGKVTAGGVGRGGTAGVGRGGTAGVGTGSGPIAGAVTGATGNVETLSGAPAAGTLSWPLSTWVS